MINSPSEVPTCVEVVKGKNDKKDKKGRRSRQLLGWFAYCLRGRLFALALVLFPTQAAEDCVGPRESLDAAAGLAFSGARMRIVFCICTGGRDDACAGTPGMSKGERRIAVNDVSGRAAENLLSRILFLFGSVGHDLLEGGYVFKCVIVAIVFHVLALIVGLELAVREPTVGPRFC